MDRFIYAENVDKFTFLVNHFFRRYLGPNSISSSIKIQTLLAPD